MRCGRARSLYTQKFDVEVTNWFASTSKPSPQPTPAPTTWLPSPAPSLLPSASPAPSLAPTSQDTAVVALTWQLVATAPPTDDDKDTLKTKILDQVGSGQVVKNFEVAFNSRRRRLGEKPEEEEVEEGGDQANHWEQGQQRTVVTWEVSFDVITTVDAASSVESSVVGDLQNSTFTADLQTSVTAITTVTVPVAVVQTRRPSSVPSPAPTSVPVPAPTSSPVPAPSASPVASPTASATTTSVSSSNTLLSAASALVIAGLAVAIVLTCVIFGEKHNEL